MRYKWFSYLLNEEGQPIKNAEISIYLSETETPAYIYTQIAGGIGNNTAPQLFTDEHGYFEFFVGESNDPLGYDSPQKFKIAWNKTGISVGHNDFLTILPLGLPININDNSIVYDKVISNNLGRLWNNHMLDETHLVHGIEEVELGSSDTVRNKLISNSMIKGKTTSYQNFSYITTDFTYSSVYEGWVRDIFHNLSQDFPSVSVYNTNTRELLPEFNEYNGYKVISLSNAAIKLIMTTNIDVSILIVG